MPTNSPWIAVADRAMTRDTRPMLYFIAGHGDRIHRGRPSLSELRRIVRRYPLTWVTA